MKRIILGGVVGGKSIGKGCLLCIVPSSPNGQRGKINRLDTKGKLQYAQATCPMTITPILSAASGLAISF